MNAPSSARTLIPATYSTFCNSARSAFFHPIVLRQVHLYNCSVVYRIYFHDPIENGNDSWITKWREKRNGHTHREIKGSLLFLLFCSFRFFWEQLNVDDDDGQAIWCGLHALKMRRNSHTDQLCVLAERWTRHCRPRFHFCRPYNPIRD